MPVLLLSADFAWCRKVQKLLPRPCNIVSMTKPSALGVVGVAVYDWRDVPHEKQAGCFTALLEQWPSLSQAGTVMVGAGPALQQRLTLVRFLPADAAADEIACAVAQMRMYHWSDEELFDTQLDMFKSLLQQMAAREILMHVALASAADAAGDAQLQRQSLICLQLVAHHASAAWRLRTNGLSMPVEVVELLTLVEQAGRCWQEWRGDGALNVQLGTLHQCRLSVDSATMIRALSAALLTMGKNPQCSASREKDSIMLGILNREVANDALLREIPPVRLEWPESQPILEPQLPHCNPCSVHLQFARAVAEAHGGEALVQQVGDRLAGFYLKLPVP